jgi:hypothetical protein
MSNGLRTQLSSAIALRLSGLGVELQTGQIGAMVDDVELIIANYVSSIQVEANVDVGQTPDPPQGE